MADDVSWIYQLFCAFRGRVAQLGERLVRNEEVAGSIPVSSTNLFSNLARFRKLQELPKLPISGASWQLKTKPNSFCPLQSVRPIRQEFHVSLRHVWRRKRLGWPRSIMDVLRIGALRGRGLGWKRIAAD